MFVKLVALYGADWPRAGAVMLEVAEEGWVTLRQACGGYLLRNCGTGEQQLLEGSWKANIDDGNVILQQADDEPIWASELFSKALMQAPRLKYDQPQLCIVNVVDKSDVWRDDIIDSGCKAHVLVCKSKEPSWQCEVFISHLPREGCCIRFSLIRVVVFLIGNHFDGHFLTKTLSSMKTFSTSLGCEATHIFDSPRSCMGKAAKNTIHSLDALRQCDPEYTCSGKGLLMLALQVMVVGRWKVSEGIDASDRASVLIEHYIEKLIMEDSCFIELHDEQGSVHHFSQLLLTAHIISLKVCYSLLHASVHVCYSLPEGSLKDP